MIEIEKLRKNESTNIKNSIEMNFSTKDLISEHKEINKFFNNLKGRGNIPDYILSNKKKYEADFEILKNQIKGLKYDNLRLDKIKNERELEIKKLDKEIRDKNMFLQSLINNIEDMKQS